MRYVLALTVAATGCGIDDIIEPGIDWVGTYDATGTWDLGGPLAGGRTLGDAVADLVVDGVVGQAGVPGPLESEARDAVAALIANDIKTLVDTNAPAELAPGSATVMTLGASLAEVEVESDIVLDTGFLPRSMTGTETVQMIAYEDSTTRYTLDVASVAASGVTVQAEWEGSGSDNSLDVDDHMFTIEYGELVKQVGEQLIGAVGLQAVADDASAAIDCTNVVNGIVGGGASFGFSVGGVNFSLTTSELNSICTAAQSATASAVLGLFSIDSRLEIGGPVTLVDNNGDDVADRLESGAGYGGIVTVAPKPIAPRITVSFTADRR